MKKFCGFTSIWIQFAATKLQAAARDCRLWDQRRRKQAGTIVNSLIQFKEPIAIGCLTLAFTSFGNPTARAVSPPPDGCYPGLATAEGCKALQHLTSGSGNTGIGWSSLLTVTTGSFNTGVGAGTLALNTGDLNTAVGTAALLSNAAGNENTAVGVTALLSNTTGSSNTAMGKDALINNTTGSSNTAAGSVALRNTTTGLNNTAVGGGALAGNSTGSGNIAVGILAGISLTTGDNNIDIGNAGVSGEANTIRIGHEGTQTSTFIAGINTASVMGTAVEVSADGQLGTVPSSERFKKDISSMEKASETIMLLRPVTFHYKTDAQNTPQFGLIAEEVAKVNAALVVRDKEGKPYSVRYNQINAMLLNEFLKEHHKVEKLEATIAKQHKDFEAALADLKEQIQKVSAQLELNKAAPQTVLNDE